MARRTSIWLVAGAALILAAAGAYRMNGRSPHAENAVPLATPAGITVESIGEIRGYSAFSYAKGRGTAFADADGLTLYTFDKDTIPGKSACDAECAKSWKPAAASADARPFDRWSVLMRDDGVRQWAYRGKPLYRYVKDARAGDAQGNAAGGVWHAALASAGDGLTLPAGILAQNVDDAGGEALTDSRGMTLYQFDGDTVAVCVPTPCTSPWRAVEAPQLANPVGDFTIVRGEDGSRRWALHGRQLFSFAGDIEPGNANGAGIDRHWQVAMVHRTFMPPGVSIRRAPGHGAVLVTADGMSLYRRSSYIFQSTSGHGFRHGVPPFPSIGHAVGTKGCDAACLKTWRPLAASPDAQPSGSWEIYTRPDGARQWAYKGYALYSYAGDKKPGDVTGHEIYDYLIKDGVHPVSDTVIPNAGADAFYWAAAYP